MNRLDPLIACPPDVHHASFSPAVSVGRANLRVSASYQSFQDGSFPPAPVGTAVAGAPLQNANGTPLLAPPPEKPHPVFQSIETAIQRTFNSQQPGQRNDWREIEGSYVLFPPNSQRAQQPEAIVHFLGAAYVGAAPSLAYRLFLEALANRNVLVSDASSELYAVTVVPGSMHACEISIPNGSGDCHSVWNKPGPSAKRRRVPVQI